MLARTLLTGLAASLFALLLPLTAAAADRAAEGGVVVLATGHGQFGIGAGTVVSKTGGRIRIITAAHVATFGALQLRMADGSVAPARLVQVIGGRDLAVIEADVAAPLAAALSVARVALPRPAEAIHVWGSGNDGPAYETGAVGPAGATLPDGAPRGRFGLRCALCHKGDSGAGVFNTQGELVGVYVGYFEIETGRLSVAETPDAGVQAAFTNRTATAVVAAANPSALSRSGLSDESKAIAIVAERLRR